MVDKPVIAVMGATGKQGGGLVDALLAGGKFAVRAITRDPSSDKVKKLAQRPGVTAVRGDTSDTNSLVEAFRGVAGAFLLTDCFTAGFSYAKELEQGKSAVDAAKEAKVPFVVFSTLEDTNAALDKNSVSVPEAEPGHRISHFEAKAAVEEYLKASGIPFATVLTGGFYENSLNFWHFEKAEDGALTFADNMGTDSKTAWHAVGDVGASAAAIFADPAKYKGQTVPVVGENISPAEVAKVLSGIAGKTVKHKQVPDAESGKGFPGAQDLANMFTYNRECPEAAALRPLEKRSFQGPTFAQWAEQHADALKAKMLQ